MCTHIQIKIVENKCMTFQIIEVHRRVVNYYTKFMVVKKRCLSMKKLSYVSNAISTITGDSHARTEVLEIRALGTLSLQMQDQLNCTVTSLEQTHMTVVSTCQVSQRQTWSVRIKYPIVMVLFDLLQWLVIETLPVKVACENFQNGLYALSGFESKSYEEYQNTVEWLNHP